MVFIDADPQAYKIRNKNCLRILNSKTNRKDKINLTSSGNLHNLCRNRVEADPCSALSHLALFGDQYFPLRVERGFGGQYYLVIVREI